MKNIECKDYEAAPIIEEGTRNDTLYKLGCALRGQHGMDHGEITAMLLEYNRAKCNPPMDEAEVISMRGKHLPASGRGQHKQIGKTAGE